MWPSHRDAEDARLSLASCVKSFLNKVTQEAAVVCLRLSTRSPISPGLWATVRGVWSNQVCTSAQGEQIPSPFNTHIHPTTAALGNELEGGSQVHMTSWGIAVKQQLSNHGERLQGWWSPTCLTSSHGKVKNAHLELLRTAARKLWVFYIS